MLLTFKCNFLLKSRKIDIFAVHINIKALSGTFLRKKVIFLKPCIFLLQLRGNQKDFNFQLHHRFSKFEVPVVVNLKHIFELFGLYTTCFLIQKLLELIRSSSDGQFWRKSQNKKGGKFELRSQLCYYNCIYENAY